MNPEKAAWLSVAGILFAMGVVAFGAALILGNIAPVVFQSGLVVGSFFMLFGVLILAYALTKKEWPRESSA